MKWILIVSMLVGTEVVATGVSGKFHTLQQCHQAGVNMQNQSRNGGHKIVYTCIKG